MDGVVRWQCLPKGAAVSLISPLARIGQMNQPTLWCDPFPLRTFRVIPALVASLARICRRSFVQARRAATLLLALIRSFLSMSAWRSLLCHNFHPSSIDRSSGPTSCWCTATRQKGHAHTMSFSSCSSAVVVGKSKPFSAFCLLRMVVA